MKYEFLWIDAMAANYVLHSRETSLSVMKRCKPEEEEGLIEFLGLCSPGDYYSPESRRFVLVCVEK